MLLDAARHRARRSTSSATTAGRCRRWWRSACSCRCRSPPTSSLAGLNAIPAGRLRGGPHRRRQRRARPTGGSRCRCCARRCWSPAVLNIIYVFNSFPIIWTLNDRNPGFAHDTTITFMYKLAFKSAEQDVGMSAAAGVFNVVLILAVVVVYLRVVNWRRRRADGRHAHPSDRAPTAPRPAGRRLAAHRRGPAGRRPVRGAGLPVRPYARHAARRAAAQQRRRADPADLPAAAWQLVHLHHRCSATSGSWTGSDLRARGRHLDADRHPRRRSPRRTSPPGSASRAGSPSCSSCWSPRCSRPTSLVVGLYREFFELGLVNTYLAIILTNAAFNLAFAIWILHGFFAAIPKEVEEAAHLDGCGRLRHAVADHAAARAARRRDRRRLHLHRRLERVRRRADPDAGRRARSR